MDSHKDTNEQIAPLSRWARNRFLLAIFGSIVVALLLATYSMVLYNSSGTAQLDLSRPGYKSVRDKVKIDNSFDGFLESGQVDMAALDEFRQLYAPKAKDALSVDAFNSDVLSDHALGIEQPTDTP